MPKHAGMLSWGGNEGWRGAGWVLKEPIEHWLRHGAGHPEEPGDGLFAAISESLVGAFEFSIVFAAMGVKHDGAGYSRACFPMIPQDG